MYLMMLLALNSSHWFSLFPVPTKTIKIKSHADSSISYPHKKVADWERFPTSVSKGWDVYKPF
jgi:hypothetical protein